MRRTRVRDRDCAIISDIHSDVEALKAVLDDIRSKGISRVICLGDVVGYGPDPAECVDVAMSFDLTMLGMHDEYALFESAEVNFNYRARAWRS